MFKMYLSAVRVYSDVRSQTVSKLSLDITNNNTNKKKPKATSNNQLCLSMTDEAHHVSKA